MSEVKQPGVRIDANLWKEFRSDIYTRKGAVRGHLKTELENAIRQYLEGGDPTSAGRLDERLARIEQAVGAASADGGTDTFDGGSHTHTPTTKPAANAATEKKVDYLESVIVESVGRDVDSVSRKLFERKIKDEYDFRGDTVSRYVERLIERFDLWEHPTKDLMLVSQERQIEILDAEAEDTLA